MAGPDATEPPWRAETDACFGSGGRSLGAVIRDVGGIARGRRVLRQYPPGTNGAAAVQTAAAAAAAIVALANGAAGVIEAVPRRPSMRRARQEDASVV